MKAKDINGLVEMYTEDAMFMDMAPTRPVVMKREGEVFVLFVF